MTTDAVPSIVLSPVDAAWLRMDSPVNRMIVTAVLHLDDRIDRERLTDVLRTRLLARYPTFTRRVATRSGGRRPHWVPDDSFDLARHLRDGGTVDSEAQLAARVGDLLDRPLDLAHSPWELDLVDAPARLTGGRRTVVVARLHHCLADGIALANVLLSLTDPHPSGRRRDEVPTADSGGRSRRERPTGRVRLAWGAVTTAVGLFLSRRDPRTRLNRRLGPRKVAGWTRRLDLGLVKRVAGALDASVNDVLLAMTAGALRQVLAAHGDRTPDIRIFVPVDLRPPGEPVPESLGNRFGLVFVHLPVAEPDLVRRVHLVRERMGRVKAAEQAVSTHAVLAAIGVLPRWAQRFAVAVLGAKCSAVVTNVPGPKKPVWLAGSRLTGMEYWVPQAGTVGLGVSLLSYAGDVSVGVAADAGVVPDAAELTAAVEREFDALVRETVPLDGVVDIEEVGFDSELAGLLIDEVQQEYVRRYGGRDKTPIDPTEFAAPDGTFLVVRLDGRPIGCAGMRRHDDDVVEVKRMFVRVEHRRRGHGRRMLLALEDWARRRGYRRVILETGVAQPEAIALYRAAGYEEIEGFGHYRDSPQSRSFARDLRVEREAGGQPSRSST